MQKNKQIEIEKKQHTHLDIIMERKALFDVNSLNLNTHLLNRRRCFFFLLWLICSVVQSIKMP